MANTLTFDNENGRISAGAGSVTATTYSFDGDPNTGIYSSAADEISFATAGIQRLRINSGGGLIVGNEIATSDGGTTDPSYTFDSDQQTGLYRASSGTIGFTSAGTQTASLSGTALTLASGIDMTVSGGGTITGLPTTPTLDTEAASKAYVDSVASGLDTKDSCQYATTVDLDSVGNGTWAQAGSGVGATLTAGTAGTTTIDGNVLSDSDRVLVKDQGTGSENGIYTASATGAGSQTILTRATDFDGSPAGEVDGGEFTFIEFGTANAGSGWVVTTQPPITVDTTAIAWSQFSGGGVTFPLLGPNGSAGTPSYSFTNDTDSGMYLASDGILGFSVAGSEAVRISSSAVDFNGKVLQEVNEVQADSGSASDPSYTFTSDLDTGMYLSGTDEVSFSTAGTQRFIISDSFTTITGSNPILQLTDTNAAADEGRWNLRADVDGLRIQALTDAGSGGGDLIQITRSGNNLSRMEFFNDGSATQAIDINNDRIELADGAAGTPSLTFLTDTNTGIYSSAGDEIGFSCGGTQRMNLTGTALEVTAGGGRNFDLLSSVTGTTATTWMEFSESDGTRIGLVGIASTGNDDLYIQADQGTIRLRTSSDDRLTIETDGTLSVSSAIAYEDLVLDDDDIPNKKYVDDAASIGTVAQIDEGTAQTTDATGTVVKAISVTAGEVITFTVRGHGVESATGDVYSTVIHGAIKNISGTTAFVGSLQKTEFNDAGASAWDITVVANDTGDTLDVTVAGEASHTIDWSIRIDYAEG